MHLCNSSVIPPSLTPSDGPQLSGSEEITVEKEEALVLQCDIWANPPVQSVSWTFNNTNVDLEATGLLETTDGFNTKLSNGRVVKSLHEGIYECSAIHAIYGRRTKTFYVTVTGQFAQPPPLQSQTFGLKMPMSSTVCNQHISG